jgi:putative peptide zinc metalloprotease protein
VLLVVPLLALSLLMLVLGLPRFLATAWDNLGKQAGVLNDNLAAGDFFGVGARALSVLAICVPIAGIAYMLTRMVRRTTKKVLMATEGRPVRRGLAGLLAAALVLGLLAAWWPNGQYRPIQPGERGTVLDGISLAVSRTGLGSPAPALREGQVGASTSVVASATSLGTKDKPTLALILLPHGGSGGPSWVFPFNKPDAPAEDGNQAMAVNTKDGSSLYDVAFALVWADGTDAQQRNEAYAFASCTACRTVAVGFQVVLIVGQANVVVPENIAAAVNYECVLCVTYALAKQLVLTLPTALSPEAMAALNQVWAQLLAFGEHIEDVPLSQIQSTLDGFAQDIKAIVEQEAGATASDSDGGAGDPGSGSDPGSTAGTGGEGTTDPGTGTDPSGEPTVDQTTEPAPSMSTEQTGESTAGAMPESTTAP